MTREIVAILSAPPGMKTTTAASDPRKDVGIWIRVSTEDQARGESPEHHEKRARYYAEAKGWRVSGTHRAGEGRHLRLVGEDLEYKWFFVAF